MDTLSFVSDGWAGTTGDKMDSASKPVTSSLIQAANADQLGAEDTRAVEVHVEKGLDSTGGGWDAYDVWRRFIKEARERRKSPDSN